ncbi:MAG: divalent metal cation transporter, partial [Planctomycetales bacterium]|nr:divalent metal cation transporter [Planctomycetales bacterium]
SSLVKRTAFDLSSALAPLLGEQRARLAFGLGVLGMGFSTIIILMVINGYAFCELAGSRLGGFPYMLGCLAAGAVGASWWAVWKDESRFYLSIVASTFGMILLPIAYITFFFMMNSRRVLKDAIPTGRNRIVWNALMLISVAGATAAAAKSIADKAGDPATGVWVKWGAIGFLLLAIPGFHFRRDETPQAAAP